jgi:hypothetical protein
MHHASIDTTLRYYVDQYADEVASELWAAHRQLEVRAELQNSLGE